MTLEQVKYLREQLNADLGEGKPVANSVFYDLDNNMAFRNVGDFVIFDDSHELLHCIAANRNNYIKNESPYCLYSAGYEVLQFTEGNLNMDGLKHVLENMMDGLIDEKQKAQIINWAENLPVNPINTVRSTYFKEPAPQVPQRPVNVITRPDGVHNGYPVTGDDSKESAPVKVVSPSKAADTISKLEDGSYTFISGSEPIAAPMTVSANNVIIAGKDAPVSNAMDVKGNGVTLKGLTFNNNKLEGNKDQVHMLTLTGNDAVLEDCTITDNGKETRNAVSIIGDTFTIRDCHFTGADGVYNCIESAYNVGKCKNVLFENCVFEKGAATNNFVSLYDFVDGAVITFRNCSFDCKASSNAIRLSNINNNHATVNIVDCKFRPEASHEWSGMVLLQDSSGDMSQDLSMITINFKNVTDFEGNKYTKNSGSEEYVEGDKTDNSRRMWYTYNADTAPVVNFS